MQINKFTFYRYLKIIIFCLLLCYLIYLDILYFKATNILTFKLKFILRFLLEFQGTMDNFALNSMSFQDRVDILTFSSNKKINIFS